MCMRCVAESTPYVASAFVSLRFYSGRIRARRRREPDTVGTEVLPEEAPDLDTPTTEELALVLAGRGTGR